MSNSLVVITR